MNHLQQQIYDRFVRYISTDTTSNPESSSVPLPIPWHKK